MLASHNDAPGREISLRSYLWAIGPFTGWPSLWAVDHSAR